MKNKIIVAALRLFLLRGYKYVSLIDVAQEVGITKGGIYHYFENKERLLYAAVQHMFDNVHSRFATLFRGEKSLREAFYAIMVDKDIERYIEDMINIKCVGEIEEESFRLELMHHFPRLHERLDRMQLELCVILREQFKKAQLTGEVRSDIDPESLAILTWTLLNGQRSTPIFFCDPRVRRQTFDALCQVLALK